MRVHGQTASAERHISNSCIHVNEIHLFFFFIPETKELALQPALHMSAIDLFPGCAQIKRPLFLTVSLNQTNYFSLARFLLERRGKALETSEKFIQQVP